jgi:anti-sigma factor RsiW
MMRRWRCRRLAAALVDYCDCGLAPAERAEVERHLARCRRCAATAAALIDAPVVLGGSAVVRDEAFWVAQRQRIMQAIAASDDRPERAPLHGFDWRLALPVAAAAVIAIAGYLSLRPPSAPGEVALDALPAADLAALVEVAGALLPTDELLPDLHVGETRVEAGAIDAGWVAADDVSGSAAWSELNEEDLDTLNGMLG